MGTACPQHAPQKEKGAVPENLGRLLPAIFESPVFPRSRTGLLRSLLCHFDRGKEQPRLTEWRNLARCVSVTNAFLFLPSPFLRGKVARAALRRVTNEGCSVFIICHSAYHKGGIPSSRRRQGAMADGSLRLPPCPLRLPLLFPKSSSILFGSPVCARQVPQGEAMYSRSVFGTAFASYTRSLD